jgi:hypothetical protein
VFLCACVRVPSCICAAVNPQTDAGGFMHRSKEEAQRKERETLPNLAGAGRSHLGNPPDTEVPVLRVRVSAGVDTLPLTVEVSLESSGHIGRRPHHGSGCLRRKGISTSGNTSVK